MVVLQGVLWSDKVVEKSWRVAGKGEIDNSRFNGHLFLWGEVWDVTKKSNPKWWAMMVGLLRKPEVTSFVDRPYMDGE